MNNIIALESDLKVSESKKSIELVKFTPVNNLTSCIVCGINNTVDEINSQGLCRLHAEEYNQDLYDFFIY